MSPILVRPVREQLEHDRIIRQLQSRWRRRYNVGINVGMDQSVPVGAGPSALYPDLVLTPLQGGRRVQGIVEVETGESVNSMEAMAQWATMARFRAPFYLYVPSGSVEVARRMCQDYQISVAEIWSYHSLGDQVRFTLVHRGTSRPAAAEMRAHGRPRAERRVAPRKRAASAAKRATRSAKARARSAKPSRKSARPAKRR